MHEKFHVIRLLLARVYLLLQMLRSYAYHFIGVFLPLLPLVHLDFVLPLQRVCTLIASLLLTMIIDNESQ